MTFGAAQPQGGARREVLLLGHQGCGLQTLLRQLQLLLGGTCEKDVGLQMQLRAVTHPTCRLSDSMATTLETPEFVFRTLSTSGGLSLAAALPFLWAADVVVAVVSAVPEEFEATVWRSAQLRFHLSLCAMAGIPTEVLLLNKMDDPAVGWRSAHFRACEGALRPVLSSSSALLRLGHSGNPAQPRPRNAAAIIPISAQASAINLTAVETSGWYSGPCLVEALRRVPGCDVGSRCPTLSLGVLAALPSDGPGVPCVWPSKASARVEGLPLQWELAPSGVLLALASQPCRGLCWAVPVEQ
eukprot:RCo019125